LRLTNYICTVAILSTLCSCERLKKNGQEIADKTKAKVSETRQKISNKKDQIIEKFFPTYDSNKPDTEHNKKRFQEHLQVTLTKDVNNIYTYGDFMGADYKVFISFSCDTSTIEKIIEAKKMMRSTKDNDEGLFFSAEFPWWNKEKIVKIKPYLVGKEYEYWQYLWYDHKSKTAYYEEFSL
jgi:hypothetical protein